MATQAASQIAILNLGCGNKRIEGAVNLDIIPGTNPDVVYDLNQRPWPFPDNTFLDVRANDVIEHLGDIPPPWKKSIASAARVPS